MDEKNKSECSYTKEQTISSTESMKANCGQSGSSNDVENLSFDNGSDDQSYDKLPKGQTEGFKASTEGLHMKNPISELKRHFFSSKNIGDVNTDEKKRSLMKKGLNNAEMSSGVTDKMLTMQRDDGYGSSNSSPHSAVKKR
ncbi:hypothetical protein RUM44_002343 [Polyplax serrata]|uniref:Uncharacterized protein n=1 Tax=Polyplax serrata TaxID=468196 RepID=A0ABR1AMJ6_POLSC